jgi:hypothetical protein
MNPLQASQPLSNTNLNPLLGSQPQSPQVINPQMSHQQIMLNQQPNQIIMQPNMQRQNSLPGTSVTMPGIGLQRGYFSFDDFKNR